MTPSPDALPAGVPPDLHGRAVQAVAVLRHTIDRRPALRQALVMTWHLLGIYLAYTLAFLLRFDGRVPLDYRLLFWHTLPVVLLIYLTTFSLFRLFSGMWSYFSLDDAVRLAVAILTGTFFYGLVIFALRSVMQPGFPRSVLVVMPMLLAFWMASARLAIRYIRLWRGHSPAPGENGDRILIVGQPDDIDLVIRASRQGGLQRPIGVVTDDPQHVGLRIHGLPIQAPLATLGSFAAAQRANCILVLPPFNRPRQLNEIVEQCATAGVACTFRTVPSLGDLAGGQITSSTIRNVDVEDLLGRGPTRFDRTEVRRQLKGKRVMITGAGGSIGSELCRQIASYEPACLVLFELSEFALYTIEQELRGARPTLKLIPCAGDIRHPEDVKAAIRAAGGIDVIYHAAAYKHVPLMEQNVSACFRTNVLGTARLAQVAYDAGVDRFVLISSDKAVHPTSIMGATKHLAERVVKSFPLSHTSFVSVRFGNVLDSSGSVVPHFKKQIASGGPVTVTTPDVRRFFMTIPEAVDLVLMAGTVGRNGDIMVLEMGDAIRIVDLARRLIELSGLVPDRDIRIAFTGLRPGEKEYEEVMTADEGVLRTAYEKIWVLSQPPGDNGAPHVDQHLIASLVEAHDEAALRQLTAELVPDHRFPWTSPPALKENAS